MQVTPMVVKILTDGGVTAQKAINYAGDYVRRFGGDVSLVKEATPEDASALAGHKVRLPRLFWGEPPAEGEKWPKYRNGGPGAFLSAFPIPKGARGKAQAPKPASKSQAKRVATQSDPAPATTSTPKAPTVADLIKRTDVLYGRIEVQDREMANLAARIGAEVGKVAAKVDAAIATIGNVSTGVVNADGDPPKRPEAPDGSVRQFVQSQVSTGTSEVHAHLDDMLSLDDKRNEEIVGILREIQGRL